jgi:hypothetical protein
MAPAHDGQRTCPPFGMRRVAPDAGASPLIDADTWRRLAPEWRRARLRAAATGMGRFVLAGERAAAVAAAETALTLADGRSSADY